MDSLVKCIRDENATGDKTVIVREVAQASRAAATMVPYVVEMYTNKAVSISDASRNKWSPCKNTIYSKKELHNWNRTEIQQEQQSVKIRGT